MIQKKKRLVGSKVLYLDVFFENVHFGLSLRLVIGFQNQTQFSHRSAGTEKEKKGYCPPPQKRDLVGVMDLWDGVMDDDVGSERPSEGSGWI